MDDRAAAIVLGGEQYELLLTTRAMKEIAARHGGLENLGDSLLNAGTTGEALDEVIWLVTLLANQGIAVSNLKNKAKKELLTTDAVELLTSPADFAGMKSAIEAALFRGMKRNVESEDAEDDGSKNVKSE